MAYCSRFAVLSIICMTVCLHSGCYECEEEPQLDRKPNVAYFVFQIKNDRDRFVIKLTDPAKIDFARRILAGKEKHRTHIMGIIVKEKKPYNPCWSYHLDPDTIDFFENAVEVCDANMHYVEDNLVRVGGALLPGNRWCPWGSKLVREL